jgi:hypothetical protein
LLNTRKPKFLPQKVHKGRKVLVRKGSKTIVLVEVVTMYQFLSGGRWNKTFLPKVSYQRSLTGPIDRRIGIMRMEAD